MDLQLKKKYGKVWGYFNGLSPCIMVYDPDIIKQIYVKEFQCFSARKIRFSKLVGKEMVHGMTNLHGKDWKRVRHSITPAFTSSKLKEMFLAIEHSVDKTIQGIEGSMTSNGIIISAKEWLTFDTILRAGFGVDCDLKYSFSASEEEHPMLKEARTLFDIDMKKHKLLRVLLGVPYMENILSWFGVTYWNQNSLNYFSKLVDAIIQQSSYEPKQKQVNIMQALLDARSTAIGDNTEFGLTEAEIKGNAMVLIMDSFDNIANTLTFLAYNLAFYQNTQIRLQQEVDNVILKMDSLNYEAISKMKFLNQCVHETLRIYTPILRNTRVCTKDVTINGVQFNKGVEVTIPSYALCHDTDYWDEPYLFKPERMENMDKIDPMIYQPFSSGPRNCIGKRFAIMEIKLAMAKILQKYTILPTENLQKPPLDVHFAPVFKPVQDVQLLLSTRK